MKSILITIVIILAVGFIYYKINFKDEDYTYKRLGEINQFVLYKHEADFCATALEVIYEDELNVYYFTCIKSSNYILKNKKKTYTLKEALQKNIITIEDLVRLEPDIVISPKADWYNSHIPASELSLVLAKV